MQMLMLLALGACSLQNDVFFFQDCRKRYILPVPILYMYMDFDVKLVKEVRSGYLSVEILRQ